MSEGDERTEDGSYWEGRGLRTFSYRGDRYYTVTPIAQYVRRRRWLLRRLERLLEALPTGGSVLDFGCGDGFYAVEIERRFPRLRIYGCDPSRAMIEAAAARAHRHRARVAFADCDEAMRHGPFDLVLIVAVLAHITDDARLRAVLAQIRDRLVPGGRVVVFEMTAQRELRGDAWRRRSPESYARLFADLGLELSATESLAAPFHDGVGARICRAVVRLGYSGDPLRANASVVYQRLTELLVAVAPIGDRLLRTCRAYTLYELRHPAHAPHKS
ncbi:MAG: class I SAM-dependent methyltransferase [Candidatus Bipolaricaulota bacterium]|nr:MAG: class I SAM-dependent methyltransferase [Candidatus Bipolaricaulota bacterium]